MKYENYTSEEELQNLKNELISAYRKNYRNTSEILENLVDISKDINKMMKTVHESLSALEGLCGKLFSEEDSFMIHEALKPEDINKILDSLSSVIKEVGRMGDYTVAINEDIGKVVDTYED